MQTAPVSVTSTPRNLCELFVRELAGLLDTSEDVGESLRALQTTGHLPNEFTECLEMLTAVNESRKIHLDEPLTTAGVDWRRAAEAAGVSLWMESLFPRVPERPPSEAEAADIAMKLRLVAQHLELRTVLAAESALLLGHEDLCQGLIAWSDRWHRCCHDLRVVTVHARMRAFVADLPDPGPAEAA